jgi:hypothetical protein
VPTSEPVELKVSLSRALSAATVWRECERIARKFGSGTGRISFAPSNVADHKV